MKTNIIPTMMSRQKISITISSIYGPTVRGAEMLSEEEEKVIWASDGSRGMQKRPRAAKDSRRKEMKALARAGVLLSDYGYCASARKPKAFL
jgi:hypothetical protein